MDTSTTLPERAMTPEQWERIRVLFEDALDRPAEARNVFLDQVCAGEVALRDEVQSLLDAHERALEASALRSPFSNKDHTPFEALRATLSEPRHIGPYRLIHELGRGGMGTVYLAERADGQFQQTVALKVIRRGLDTDDLLSRFRYERQILAALDHPNIARLYDGGTTEAAPTEAGGRPYFVMEYVDGVPLTDYCNAKSLSTRQRLALFRTVCRAVQYAHQNLVVHRDLKPSNILVTEEGAVKLLDFGIAKLLDEEALDQTVPRTRTGMRLMTPEYAAPEQIKGETITTATDVYQLGVLLYELLTGHRPYRLHERVQHEIERVILQEEPTRPSTAVEQTEKIQQGDQTTKITPEGVSQARSTSVEALQRRLSGDLDNIVLKALKKEPGRRYASVEQLAEDLRRHLVGLPVMARRDTVGYRMSKFVRRHKVGVGATAAVAVLLVAVAVLAIRFAVTTAAQAEAIAREAAKAEQINTFLQDMLASADPRKEGREVKVVEVLDEAAERVAHELADQPEVLAEARRTLGTTYSALALFDAAEPHLRAAYDMHRQLFGEQHRETAKSLSHVAFLLIGQGDLAGADSLLRKALAIQRKMLSEDDPDLAATLYYLGNVLTYKGELAAAEPLLREASDAARKAHGNEHKTVATALFFLSENLRNQGDLDSAEASVREAIKIFRTLPGRKPVEMAYSLFTLGMILGTEGEYAESESALRESVVLTQSLLGDTHPSYGFAVMQLGNLYYDLEDYERAEAEIRRSLDILRQTLPEEHVHIAGSKILLGLTLTRAGRPAEALPAPGPGGTQQSINRRPLGARQHEERAR